jgi:hypothetical protein
VIRLLGLPTQIILDPTDLFALPMIALAGRLWVTLERTAPAPKLGWEAYLVLGTAALATMATSCPPPLRAQRLTVWDNGFYAGYGLNWIIAQNSDAFIAVSQDEGRSWRRVDDPPAVVVEALASEIQLPVVVCSLVNDQLCYRITGREEIEETHNGGSTWAVVWQPKPDRLDFQKRTLRGAVACSTGILWNVPIDLALLDTHRGVIVVASMKYNGILVKDSDGVWTPYPVYDVRPISTSASSIAEAADLIQPEAVTFAMFALFTLFAFLCLTRESRLRQAKTTTLRFGLSYLLTWLGIVLPFVWFGMFGATQLSAKDDRGFGSLVDISLIIGRSDYGQLGWLVVALASLIILVIWRVQWRSQARMHDVWQTELAGWLVSLAIFLMPSCSFILWALGLIVRYQTAWILAWGESAVLFFVGAMYVFRRATRST